MTEVTEIPFMLFQFYPCFVLFCFKLWVGTHENIINSTSQVILSIFFLNKQNNRTVHIGVVTEGKGSSMMPLRANA